MFDNPCRVIQDCITMKTASVRDLRNNFADLAKWIEHGEEITITRRGKNFATLRPLKPDPKRKIDWAARFAKRPPLGKGISKTATEKLWSDMRD